MRLPQPSTPSPKKGALLRKRNSKAEAFRRGAGKFIGEALVSFAQAARYQMMMDELPDETASLYDWLRCAEL